MSADSESRSLPRVGVGCMLMRDNKVLLGRRRVARRRPRHGAGTYGWLGGHLAFGETLEECAERKVYEESGLVVKSLKLLCVSNVIEYGTHYIDVEFFSDEVEGEPTILKPTIESWGWYSLDKLPSPLFKPIELAINSYFSDKVYNP